MTAENGHKDSNAKTVALDLDTLEREGERPGPFMFTYAGTTFQLRDPQDMDWQDLLIGFRNPALFIRSALAGENTDKFLDTKLPSWKLDALLGAYQKHYGLPKLGELNALLR